MDGSRAATQRFRKLEIQKKKHYLYVKTDDHDKPQKDLNKLHVVYKCSFVYAPMSQYEGIIIYKRAVDSKSTAYYAARPKLLTDDRTDRQTDTVLKARSLSKGRATCLSSIPAKKIMRCRLHVKKDGKIDLKHLLQFPAQPSHILGSTENITFVHLLEKSKYLKADFL